MNTDAAAIIMAAGRGSRMIGYQGNKTLLPLDPQDSIFEGRTPILLHLMGQLPTGPKAIVVHHCQEAVRDASRHLDAVYCEQPLLNGTGGAILAAKPFIDELSFDGCIITMGDVPFVRRETYLHLLACLQDHAMVVLGFRPQDKKQYGLLEIENGAVRCITEWKYWKNYPASRQADLTICNSGIYAASREALQQYLPILASRPQIVHKEINGQMTPIEEFFFTDLIELMVADGRTVGCVVSEDETETMGIDDQAALENAQRLYKQFKQGIDDQ